MTKQEVVINGAQAWMGTTAGGKTQVVHTTGTTWNDVADDPSRRHSLTDVLTEYSSDKACKNAQLQGEASVAGQAAYVIAVTPKPETCSPKEAFGTITAEAQSSKQSSPPKQLGKMLVWVDKVSFIPLKVEVRDSSGLPLDQSEVLSIQYNITIPDSLFSYTAPAGAGVFNYTGGTGADAKKALCAASFLIKCQEPQPGKKP